MRISRGADGKGLRSADILNSEGKIQGTADVTIASESAAELADHLSARLRGILKFSGHKRAEQFVSGDADLRAGGEICPLPRVQFSPDLNKDLFDAAMKPLGELLDRAEPFPDEAPNCAYFAMFDVIQSAQEPELKGRRIITLLKFMKERGILPSEVFLGYRNSGRSIVARK